MNRRLVMPPPRLATMDTRTVKPLPKAAEPFYSSGEWRQLVSQLITERGRRCEECSRTSSAGHELRVFADHVVELRDGGAPLDPDNIRLLCGRCHTKKTLAERAKRLGAGPDAPGTTGGTTRHGVPISTADRSRRMPSLPRRPDPVVA